MIEQHDVMQQISESLDCDAEKTKHICTVCNKEFTRKVTLEEHQKQHREENSQRCEYCGKILSTVSNLKRHLKIHDQDQEFKDARFVCEYCGQQFTSNSNLKRHMDVHEDKVYSCNLCDNTYSRLDTLNAHINKWHK